MNSGVPHRQRTPTSVVCLLIHLRLVCGRIWTMSVRGVETDWVPDRSGPRWIVRTRLVECGPERVLSAAGAMVARRWEVGPRHEPHERTATSRSPTVRNGGDVIGGWGSTIAMSRAGSEP